MHIQTIQTMIHVISGTHEKESEDPNNILCIGLCELSNPYDTRLHESCISMYTHTNTHRHVTYR